MRVVVMKEKRNKLSFIDILSQALSVWLVGGMILWLAEMLFILLSLPQSWDYKFLRDGMSVAGAVRLTLLPEKISMALLFFCGLSFVGGLLTACIIPIMLRRNTEVQINAAVHASFPAFMVFPLGAFWLNMKYLTDSFTVKGILLNSTWVFLCVICLYLCFKMFMMLDRKRSLAAFMAGVFSGGCLVFGGLSLRKIFAVSLPSMKGMVFSLGLIVVCVGLFYITRNILYRLRPLNTAASNSLRKWIFSTAFILILSGGLIVVVRASGAGDVSGSEERSAGRKPNILFIVMDTTRADHFSCYGYKRETTPHIDQIAGEGVLFKNAVSPSSWTLPSHASMFTGLFPVEHGTGHVSSHLPPGIKTMADFLKAEGYKTLAYSNNPWVSFFTGLSRNFDDFQEGWKKYDDRYFYEMLYNNAVQFMRRHDPTWQVRDHGAARTTEYVKKWIRKHHQSPFFVFINFMEPHLPYDPPEPYKSLYLPTDITDGDVRKFSPSSKDVRGFLVERERDPKELSVIDALYDGEVRYVDEKIGELYELLKELDIIHNTLIIITSDHGDNLGDHGIVGHAFGLFNTLIDVPLILRYPEYFEPGTVVEEKVQTTDIFYTVLDAVGVKGHSSKLNLGRSLIQRINGNDYQDFLIAEHDKPVNALRWANNLGIDARHVDKDQRTIIMNGYKYIETSLGEEELYHLDQDPTESENILQEYREVAADLKTLLTGVYAEVPSLHAVPEDRQMDRETMEQLKSLGYMQ